MGLDPETRLAHWLVGFKPDRVTTGSTLNELPMFQPPNVPVTAVVGIVGAFHTEGGMVICTCAIPLVAPTDAAPSEVSGMGGVWFPHVLTRPASLFWLSTV